jgi:hypothetical protein
MKPCVFSLEVGEKPRLFFVFGFDGVGESLYFKSKELKMLCDRVTSTMDLEEEESDKEEWSPPNPTYILSPSCIIYDPLNLIHTQDV